MWQQCHWVLYIVVYYCCCGGAVTVGKTWLQGTSNLQVNANGVVLLNKVFEFKDTFPHLLSVWFTCRDHTTTLHLLVFSSRVRLTLEREVVIFWHIKQTRRRTLHWNQKELLPIPNCLLDSTHGEPFLGLIYPAGTDKSYESSPGSLLHSWLPRGFFSVLTAVLFPIINLIFYLFL